MSAGHEIPGWSRGESDGQGESVGQDVPAGPVAPEPSHAERARTLVAGQTRGALSTIGLQPPGTPFGSVVTYGLDDTGRPTFFVSSLAEHTRNLDADPRASLLVVEDTPAGVDPLASGRVTLLGVATEVRDPDERAQARSGYLAANPGAFYVEYGDFKPVRLAVTEIRYVGGFGRMSWVDDVSYAAARPDPLRSDAAGIIAHVNADHGDSLVALCRHVLRRPEIRSGVMTAVDRYGFEVLATFGGDHRESLRVGWRAPQDSADGVRQEFISMIAAISDRGATDRGTGTDSEAGGDRGG